MFEINPSVHIGSCCRNMGVDFHKQSFHTVRNLGNAVYVEISIFPNHYRLGVLMGDASVCFCDITVADGSVAVSSDHGPRLLSLLIQTVHNVERWIPLKVPRRSV